MGAIPETLVESELFGYEKGAFTGAEKKKKGFFEIAHEGTLVIEELQNMSTFIQCKLLNAVENRRIYPLGGTNPVHVDVRIIGVTNANFKKSLKEKKLREDLFYRLSEVMISIPPLRERREDISFFTKKFLLEICGDLHKKLLAISVGAQGLLNEYQWPGNIRELKNVVRRSVLFSSDGDITRDHIACCLGDEEGCNTAISTSPINDRSLMSLNDAEKILIKKVLEFSGGNKSKTASILQIDYKTLLRKIKHFGI
jgi:transcriptional regulator with PAS, ATPase and Fis domain